MIEVEERDGDRKYYWMICDNCSNFTLAYDSENELALAAMEEGWRKKSWLNDKHFCGIRCEIDYVTKMAERSLDND